MSDDTFFHDLERFEPQDSHGGIDIADAEAKYADLFAEALEDGEISPEQRERLDLAADMFGLGGDRLQQLEQSLIASFHAREQITEESIDHDPSFQPKERSPSLVDSAELSQMVPAADPGARALQRRVGVLEEQNDALTRDNFRLAERIDAFENLVAQLQYALETTMEDLEAARLALASEKDKKRAPPPAKSLTQARVKPPAAIAAPPPSVHSQSERVTGPPPPAQSAVSAVRQPRHNPAELHARLRRYPRDISILRALFEALGRAADLDRRWCIAHALVFLGHANDREQELYEKHRSEHLVRPRRAINDDEWRELLFHPAEEELTGEILAAIAPAVLLGQITAIRASISPTVVDPEKRVDPKHSTLQAVRCVNWASAFLGLRMPPLYACPEHDSMIDVVLNPTPSTRLGMHALSGRSSKELAFVAGRHLSWYRREHLLGRPSRSVRRLEEMFLAALMIGNPGLPLSDDIAARVEPIARTIRPLIDSDAVETLQHCFARFVEVGGRTNLAQWLRGAERTADCTGLLLCDDLWAAHTMLSLEDPAHAEVSIDDLICFLTAERCTMLRARIGIAVDSP